MGFFDQHPQYAEKAARAKPEKDTPASPFLNDLTGECQDCGSWSDNVMFGFCEECADVPSA